GGRPERGQAEADGRGHRDAEPRRVSSTRAATAFVEVIAVSAVATATTATMVSTATTGTMGTMRTRAGATAGSSIRTDADAVVERDRGDRFEGVALDKDYAYTFSLSPGTGPEHLMAVPRAGGTAIVLGEAGNAFSLVVDD